MDCKGEEDCCELHQLWHMVNGKRWLRCRAGRGQKWPPACHIARWHDFRYHWIQLMERAEDRVEEGLLQHFGSLLHRPKGRHRAMRVKVARALGR